MIIAFEMNGVNDTRPFMLTWQYGEHKFYSLDIEKNMSRADLQAGWNKTGEDHNFHINLVPSYVEVESLTEEDNGEHRFWGLTITDVFGDEPVLVGSGTVAWGEFFVMDGLTEDDMTKVERDVPTERREESNS